MQRRTFLLASLLPALLASAAESSEIDPKNAGPVSADKWFLCWRLSLDLNSVSSK